MQLSQFGLMIITRSKFCLDASIRLALYMMHHTFSRLICMYNYKSLPNMILKEEIIY